MGLAIREVRFKRQVRWTFFQKSVPDFFRCFIAIILVPLEILMSKDNVTWSSDHSGRRGGGSPTNMKKKSENMRFYKSCHTLSTIQPRKKTQLTKFVSPLKKFDFYSNTLVQNRIFVHRIVYPPLFPKKFPLNKGYSFSELLGFCVKKKQTLNKGGLLDDSVH